MRCQFGNTIFETMHILHHQIDLCLDQTRRLMHAGITQNSSDRMQQQHQIIRPRHIDTRLAAGLDQLWQLNIDFGINRFGR